MTTVIRKTYPRDFSIGVLVIIAVLVFFLSPQLFEKGIGEEETVPGMYLAELLVSAAVIIMILILWEEILFPVQIKPEDGGLMFRNHKRKLLVQVLIYLCIPAIVTYLILNYEVDGFRFYVWAGIVVILPIAGKLISGINNYNDFLKLTPDFIEYKDNEKEGSFELKDIRSIAILRDKEGYLNELEIRFQNSEKVLIHVYQMELEDFYESIEDYIRETYGEKVLG